MLSYCIGHITPDKQSCQYKVIWSDLEEQWRKMGNMMGSAGTQCDFCPPLSLWPFFTSQFGQLSNKTISKYGNPGPTLMQTPPSLLFLSSSLALGSWPQETGGQVYFLHGGPFGLAARPLPRRHWCIRCGSLKRCWWDSFIATALNLIVPVEGYLVLSFFACGEQVRKVGHCKNTQIQVKVLHTKSS